MYVYTANKRFNGQIGYRIHNRYSNKYEFTNSEVIWTTDGVTVIGETWNLFVPANRLNFVYIKEHKPDANI